MWHNADNEVGMEVRTSLLMAKYGITSIPALVLLDKCWELICADAQDKCVEDPEGQAFPWRQQSWFPRAAEMSVRANTAQLARGQGKETPYQWHKHGLLPGQPGGVRLLILTFPHGPGCDQNPHARGPRDLQGVQQSGCQ
jgi:hypothetical protein